jgi:ectoine hydroxylase-related dioxygenase (phytanoyl-CoA dioxygenase family)
MPVLSQQDLAFFHKNGYVIAREVIDRAQAERTAQAVWAFSGKKPDDPETWYEEGKGIMVEVYHQQAMWDNRTNPRVHQAFSQVWNNEKLWVSHDRASISPPNRDPEAKEHNLHWDMNIDNPPFSFGVQGVLYLNDTPAEQGAFICVPGFQHKLEDWLANLPKGAKPKEQDLLALGTKRIGAEAGDLVLWQTALPHTASLNRGTSPRVAQYITMSPAGEKNPDARQRHVAFWRDRLAGFRYAEEREHDEVPPAKLTPLGRKLVGLDPWHKQENSYVHPMSARRRQRRRLRG